jgi:hypothetical protein
LANLPSWKAPVAKQMIVKHFYAEAYRSNYSPQGTLRLYRLTSTPPEGGKRSFRYHSVRIKNPEELTKTKLFLDYFAGKLNWQKLPPLLKDLEEQLKKEETIDPSVVKIVQQYPKAAVSMLKAFDSVYHGRRDIEEMPLISEYMNTAFKSLLGRQQDMIAIQLDLLNELNKEKKPEGMKRLLKLLEEYDLPQITSVASVITDRLQKLRVFEAQIRNENAYELKGKNSIHNQLASALWLLDDSYWLLHSNRTLATLVQNKYPLSGDERLRPDFIFADNKADLVIVQLKRPRHAIEIEDINQLQDYLAGVDEFEEYGKNKKGFMIGESISDHNQKIVDQQKNLEFKSYVRLVDDCRRRYQEYLTAIDKSKE